MGSSVPLQLWYVGFQIASALVVAITGYLVATRTDSHDRGPFIGYMAMQAGWLVVSAAKLLIREPAAKYALSLVADLLAVGAVAALGYFATLYTNRSTSPRRPRNALFLGWVAVAVGGVVTQPWLGLQYRAVSYQAAPVAYLGVEPGPIYLLNSTMAVVVVVVSFVYLAQLFVSSAHRPSGSLVLLAAAVLASLLPNAVSTLARVPVLPGYDYSVFGSVPLTVVLAYTVFFRGELDLAPMARNEIVDHIDDALFGLDDTGRVVDYNAAAASLLPADAGPPVGEPLSTLLPGLAAELSLPAAGDGDVSVTYSTVRDGERTHYAVSVSPIVERDTVAGHTVVVRDVTELEASKRELERQNEQLDAFASTVAHDLQNPLQVADGASTLLSRQLRATDGGAPAAADRLDRVGDAIARIDTRLDELETLAKHAQSVTETRSVDFGAAVRSAWDRGERRLTVVRDGTIEAEPGRLDSIFEQLVRYSAERDVAHVEVELTETGFTYTDDGRRIPDGEREGVFDSETTTAVDSVGLGLEIVRTQVEAQGWRVDIESSARGSEFVVTGAATSVAEVTR